MHRAMLETDQSTVSELQAAPCKNAKVIIITHANLQGAWLSR